MLAINFSHTITVSWKQKKKKIVKKKYKSPKPQGFSKMHEKVNQKHKHQSQNKLKSHSWRIFAHFHTQIENSKARFQSVVFHHFLGKQTENLRSKKNNRERICSTETVPENQRRKSPARGSTATGSSIYSRHLDEKVGEELNRTTNKKG